MTWHFFANSILFEVKIWQIDIILKCIFLNCQNIDRLENMSYGMTTATSSKFPHCNKQLRNSPHFIAKGGRIANIIIIRFSHSAFLRMNAKYHHHQNFATKFNRAIMQHEEMLLNQTFIEKGPSYFTSQNQQNISTFGEYGQFRKLSILHHCIASVKTSIQPNI